MKPCNHPDLAVYHIPHPVGAVPEEMKPWAGAYVIPRASKTGLQVKLRVIASRAGCDVGPAEPGDDWDHVSVSLPHRCPTWEEMCFIKELFFWPDEVAMQLHPVADYINNHAYCLHLWRPTNAIIPLPPSFLVGLPELNLS